MLAYALLSLNFGEPLIQCIRNANTRETNYMPINIIYYNIRLVIPSFYENIKLYS